MLDRISHSFTLLTCEMCNQNNCNISKHPCIIFYIMETIWLILRLRYYMGISINMYSITWNTYTNICCPIMHDKQRTEWLRCCFLNTTSFLATSVNVYPEVRLSAIVMIYIRFLAIVTFCKISSNHCYVKTNLHLRL